MSNYQLLALCIVIIFALSTLEIKIAEERKAWEKHDAELQAKKKLTREDELENEVARLNQENMRLAQENAKKGFR